MRQNLSHVQNASCSRRPTLSLCSTLAFNGDAGEHVERRLFIVEFRDGIVGFIGILQIAHFVLDGCFEKHVFLVIG